MSEIYYDSDASPEVIKGRRIAILGYGGQGHAHAQNLRDSGCLVRIGLYRGSRSWERAEADGFEVQAVEDVCAWADFISVLLADQLHRQVFEDSIAGQLRPGTMLLFAHGFSVQSGLIKPPPGVDVGLVAPVSPGSTLRRLFLDGVGVPAVLAIHQDADGQAEDLALSYARALGCTRAGVVRTTFAEETATDLFGEQVVLCGGLTALIRAGFDTLVAAGYQPELAYFECVHQVKLIVDLIYNSGMAGMFEAVSDTAEFGAYVTGPRIIDDHVRREMARCLNEIQDGTFARFWIAEFEAGMPNLAVDRAASRGRPLEEVGRRLREMMPWLKN